MLELAEEPRHLYSDYISPTALTYYDVRQQEAKNFERNDAKVEKLTSTAAKLFGTDAWPGTWVQSVIETQLQAFDEYTAAREAGTRLWIHELARTEAPQAIHGQRPFLLVMDPPSRHARKLLDRPGVSILRQTEVRSLTLYELEIK